MLYILYILYIYTIYIIYYILYTIYTIIYYYVYTQKLSNNWYVVSVSRHIHYATLLTQVNYIGHNQICKRSSSEVANSITDQPLYYT